MSIVQINFFTYKRNLYTYCVERQINITFISYFRGRVSMELVNFRSRPREESLLANEGLNGAVSTEIPTYMYKLTYLDKCQTFQLGYCFECKSTARLHIFLRYCSLWI